MPDEPSGASGPLVADEAPASGRAQGADGAESRGAPVGGAARYVRAAAATPALVPCLLGTGIAVALTQHGAGFGLNAWGLAAVVYVALLAVSVWALGADMRSIPVSVRVALAAFAAYTFWSLLSITWAADPGEAWIGADRTLLYLVVFVLFALWRQRPASAAVVLCAWTLATAALALLLVVRLGGANAAHALFIGDRLSRPADYPNAAAAAWLMPVWPAVALAAARTLPPLLRGVLAAAAVVLVDVALLAQSRGSALAVAVVLVVWLAVFPERLRRLAVLAPVAVAVAVGTPTLLDVGTRLVEGAGGGALGTAQRMILLEALLVLVAVAAGAALEPRIRVGATTARRARRAVGAGVIAAVAAGAIVALVLAGGPSKAAHRAWHSFKGGYSATSTTGPRLISGLGSNRYDFFRVGLDVFVQHPVLGVGADNFATEYLKHGRSDETPRYPHSVEVRTLEQTGMVGALLLLGAFAAALLAFVQAARSQRSFGALAVAAAAGPVLYWLAHGSVDWLWETAGLGVPAFAMLGLGCALAPRRTPALARNAHASPRPLRRRLVAVAGVVVLAAVLLTFAAPWLADREVTEAARMWPTGATAAYTKLHTARTLDPLSTRPDLAEGAIAVELGDLSRADRAFERALQREPGSSYALLQRGAIASHRGRRADAERLIGAAAALAPRDAITANALRRVRAGGRVSPQEIDHALATSAARFGA